MEIKVETMLEMIGRELAFIERRLHEQDQKILELQSKIDEMSGARVTQIDLPFDAIKSSDLTALENRLKIIYERMEKSHGR